MTGFHAFVPKQRFQPTLSLSPDGTRLAYSSNASGQFNLWVRPVDGGPARQLTGYTDHAVRIVAWSPDGSAVAFTADHHGDEQYQIYLVPAAGGEPRRLSPTDGRQHELAIVPFTPDGGTLVYAGNDRDPSVQDVLVHGLTTGAVGRVESTPGEMMFPWAVSPDGRWVLTLGARSNNDSTCYLTDLTDPDLKTTAITPRVDEQAMYYPGPWLADSSGCYLRTDAGGETTALVRYDLGTDLIEPVHRLDWDVEDVAVSADGGTLAWVVNVDGVSRLYARRGGVAVDVPEVPQGVITGLTVSADGSTAAFQFNAATRPTELAVVDLGAAGQFRYLTDTRPPGLAKVEPVQPELIRFPTHDGRRIPAWLYRPGGDGPFPVVLSIHGGPEWQERPTYAYAGLYQYLLTQGIGVLAPNVRGSTGYGKTYQRLILRDFGGAELGDFEHAVRYLRELDWVRPDRIAVFGGSYGGFATLSCVSRLPSLFAAGVSVVGPSNLVTFARSVPPTWRPVISRWVGDPETEADFLMSRSPITYADAIVAPLFIIQGAKDPRVAQAESDQIVEKLRSRGVDVRYDVYPDEGHGFTSKANEQRALSDIAGFLCSQLR